MKARKEYLKTQPKNGFGYVIRSLDGPSATITKSGSGETNYIVDPRITVGNNNEFVRRLSIRECARLQGYPEEYQFTAAKSHSYQQLGNSVAVMVIRAIAEQINRFYRDPTMVFSANIITEFLQSLDHHRAFETSNRRSLKWITEMIQDDSLPISDPLAFLQSLQPYQIVSAIGGTYITFHPSLSRLADSFDFITYLESIAPPSSPVLRLNVVSTPSSSSSSSSSPPPVSVLPSPPLTPPPPPCVDVVLLAEETHWCYSYDGQTKRGESALALLAGLYDLLSLLSTGHYKIYLKSKKFLQTWIPGGYGLLSLSTYIPHLDTYIATNWRNMSISEVEMFQRVDYEIRHHIYGGSMLDWRYLRLARHNTDSTYLLCHQTLRS